MSADSGRQALFLDLVTENQGLIRKVAALYARDRTDREDLFQEIALQLWRSFESYRGEAAFSTFLYRVALNTALLRARAIARRPRMSAVFAPDTVAAPEGTRDEEEVEQLFDAIRELPPIDRGIVLLVLEERTHAEIAAVTGLSVGNVGVRLVRSRERLRRRLDRLQQAGGGWTCSTKP